MVYSRMDNELEMIIQKTKKHIDTKKALGDLNDFIKKQISINREETAATLQEEKTKRECSIKGYHNAMSELGGLMQHNTENLTVKMTDEVLELLNEIKEGKLETSLKQSELEVKLLESNVAKAQIEVAEVKADLTKEKLDYMHDLNYEKERSIKLDEAVELSRQQSILYEGEIEKLNKTGDTNSALLQGFNRQIEQLTKQMNAVDRETRKWKQQTELSRRQMREMRDTSLAQDEQLVTLYRKLESMVKLNKTLNAQKEEIKLKLSSRSTPSDD